MARGSVATQRGASAAETEAKRRANRGSFARAEIGRAQLVLIVIPVLVVGVGLFVLISSFLTMRGSVELMAAAHFAEVSRGVAHRTESTLLQAPDVLARLEASYWLDPEVRREGAGLQMVELLRSHEAVSWVTFSQPDGHHLGAFRESDGAILVNEVHLDAQRSATLRHYRAVGQTLTLSARREDTGFDPRTRPFYTLALSAPGRHWTDPYIFFDRGLAGITATQAVHDGDGALRGVMTVDFDLQSLSRFLAGLDTVEGAGVVVFDEARRVIAYSRSTLDVTRDRRDEGQIPTAQDFDEALRAFHEAQRSADWSLDPSDTTLTTREGRFEVEDEVYLASTTRFVADGRKVWFVGAFAPRASLMGPARANNVRGIVISMAGLVLGFVFAVVFAQRITRARRAVERAQADADAARKEAAELGSYRLVEKLGEGGMGEVWRAEHAMLARPAAIKLIKASRPHSPGEADLAVQRFIREARATAQLASRHTIDIYDFGVSDDGSFFYVMELLDGVDLESLVRSAGPMPAGRVVHLLSQVCDSLAEAHDAGLVHRDVKPANIYVSRLGRDVDVVKVLDFGLVMNASALEASEGLAQGDGRITEDGSITGTPAYMAPEAIAGHGVDHRVDLYALGCVGYLMLTGTDVFETESATGVMLHHASSSPEPASTRLPGVNKQLEAVVMACLAKSPAQRPQTADALRRMLEAVTLAPGEQWSGERAGAWWSSFDGVRFARGEEGSATLPNVMTLHKRTHAA